MKETRTIAEKSREATEKKLLDTIGEMIAEEGFEKIGVNAVAARSGFSKILIYRYFGSVKGLMATYIRRNDFWLNFSTEVPDRSQLPSFIKKTFRSLIEQLRTHPTLKRLYRWELSCNNDLTTALREQRERSGRELVRKISLSTGYPEKEIASFASILTASVSYLVMLEDFCPVYNGIAINTASGWEQIYAGIEQLVDRVFPAEG